MRNFCITLVVSASMLFSTLLSAATVSTDLANMSREELGQKLHQQYSFSAGENEPQELKELRIAWLKATGTQEFFDNKINGHAAALAQKLADLRQLLQQVERNGSLVTSEFFGAKAAWILEPGSTFLLSLGNPLCVSGYDCLWENEHAVRRVGDVSLSFAGYDAGDHGKPGKKEYRYRVSFGLDGPYGQAQDAYENLTYYFQKAGVKPQDINAATYMVLSSWMDFIELAQKTWQAEALALASEQKLYFSGRELFHLWQISARDTAKTYRYSDDDPNNLANGKLLRQHLGELDELIVPAKAAELIDQKAPGLFAAEQLSPQLKDLILKQSVALFIRPQRVKFAVGQQMSAALRDNEIIKFAILLDELVSAGIAEQAENTSERGVEFAVYQDAQADGDHVGRILFNEQEGIGYWETRAFAMRQQFAEIDTNKELEQLQQDLETYLDNVRNDVLQLYLEQDTNNSENNSTGSPF